MSRKKRLAVFASGTGSNFEAIVTACEQGKIPAETVALVCDKPSARVVERASRHGVKSFTFDPKSFASKVEMETVIADFLDERGGFGLFGRVYADYFGYIVIALRR